MWIVGSRTKHIGKCVLSIRQLANLPIRFRTCFKKQEIVPKRSGFGNPLRAALGGSR